MDLLAQTSIDPAAATAWATTGAAGLLGLVLFWLAYYHLPAKDKQVTELVIEHNARTDAKDAKIYTLIDATISAGEKSRADFTVALDKVVTHCAEENTKAREVWQNGIEPKIVEVIAAENAKALEKVLQRQRELEGRK